MFIQTVVEWGRGEWGSGGGRKHNRTSREKRKQNEPSQTTIKGEKV